MQPNWREGRATAEAPGQQPLYLEARGLGACHPHLFTGQKDHLQGGGGVRGEGAVPPRATGALSSRVDTRAGMTQSPLSTRTKAGPQDLHKELAGYIHAGFFPSHPKPQNSKHGINKERKTGKPNQRLTQR